MEIKVYNYLPDDSKVLREEVFVKEQGFCDEFDEIDNIAKHLICYENNKVVATSRYFITENGDYIIGRFAVKKEYRNKHIGSKLLKATEDEIVKSGGKRIVIHAQYDKAIFYQKNGYVKNGIVDFEQNYKHVYLFKNI